MLSPYVDKYNNPISHTQLISVDFSNHPMPLLQNLGQQSGTALFDSDTKEWRFHGDGIVILLNAVNKENIECLT